MWERWRFVGSRRRGRGWTRRPDREDAPCVCVSVVCVCCVRACVCVREREREREGERGRESARHLPAPPPRPRRTQVPASQATARRVSSAGVLGGPLEGAMRGRVAGRPGARETKRGRRGQRGRGRRQSSQRGGSARIAVGRGDSELLPLLSPLESGLGERPLPRAHGASTSSARPVRAPGSTTQQTFTEWSFARRPGGTAGNRTHPVPATGAWGSRSSHGERRVGRSSQARGYEA